MQKSAGKAAAGFTLLEVLVATAILGTAIAALFGTLSGALGNARRLREPERVLMLAEAQMNELLVGRGAAVEGRAALRLDQPVSGEWDEQTRWEARAEPAAGFQDDAAARSSLLVRIDLTARWNSSGGRERSLTLETLQLWPRE